MSAAFTFGQLAVIANMAKEGKLFQVASYVIITEVVFIVFGVAH